MDFNTKKRIAIITPEYPALGSNGIATAHQHLFKMLITEFENEYDIHLFSLKKNPTGTSTEPEKAHFSKSKSIDFFLKIIFRILGNHWAQRRCYHFRDLINHVWLARGLRSQIKIFNPDLVITPDHGAPLLGLDLKKNTKVIWISHHNPKRFLRKLPSEKHSKTDIKFALFFERMSLKKVSHFQFPSEYMKSEFENAYQIQTKNKTSVIPNIIQTPEFKAFQTNPFPEKRRILYIAGGGNPLKGATDVPKILETLEQKLEEKIAVWIPGKKNSEINRDYKNITLIQTGPISQAELWARLVYVDVCINLALIESFGMALIEAALLKIPCISYDTDAIPEVFQLVNTQHKLVKAQDTESVSKAILDFLQLPKPPINEKIEHLNEELKRMESKIKSDWVRLIQHTLHETN